MATENLSLNLPDAAALGAEAESAESTADFLQITDAESAAVANDELRAMKQRVKELDAKRKELTKPLDATKKGIMNLFRAPIERYEAAIKKIQTALIAYQAEEERKRLEAERAAAALAAAERKALEQKADAADSAEEAEALREAAAIVTAAPVAAAAPVKLEGTSFSKKWRGKVTDLPAFLRYVADHTECFDLVEVKQGALDRFIAATGGAARIPGVESYQETIVSTRSH